MALGRITSLGAGIRRWLKARRTQRAVRRWRQNGCPAPPPHAVKQRVLRDYATAHGCRVMVETGTFRGDMVEAMRPHVDRVYTIELSESLWRQASERFAGDDRVEVIFGDSAVELAKVIPRLTGPTLFWLDGHWSAADTAMTDKETPISEELDRLLPLVADGHVLLIDDARCFGSANDYPAIDAVRDRVGAEATGATVEVEHDIIRITPRVASRAAA